MTPERWARLRSIFNQAVEAPIAERANLIAAACAGDDELRREVEEMLAFDAGSEERLVAAIGGAVTEAVHGDQSRLIGTVIGPYRIRGVLGYGGMGTVYDAERADDQFKQRVAIKLVQQMAVHPQLRTRLRAERQILANLDHPYIARLIDGGETANGTPYLVIEFVDGVAIDRYCDTHRLSVEERLVLFEKVCAAVDFAHRNLVVHRDLKPANILVTPGGTPKLLDFGIAKLLNPDPAWNTVAVTRVQDRLLTPEHASPEQVLGRAITTASDVYALGALLYALLGGRSPYALKNSTPRALERAICNEDPPRLSSLFRKGPDGAGAEDGFDPREVAAKRGVSLTRMRRLLEGDIDEVVLRAMRKEPEQRYATAGQLAEELLRHRTGEAVAARQGVRRYRVAKFLRRNALSVSMVSVVIVALATFASFMWRQTQRLEEQKALVTQERDLARQVSSFLVEIFASADPYHTQGEEVTARELLDRGAERVKNDLNEQPEVRAQMLDSIGYAYQRQGMFARAVPLLEQALEIRRRSGNTSNKALATNLLNLGNALRDAGNAATAQLYYDQALALTRELAGERSVEAARVLVSMARLARENNSQLEQALGLFNEALAIYRERYGSDHEEVASTLSDLANLLLWKGGDLAVAERHQREALRIYQLQVKRTHPDYATALGALGMILLQRGAVDEADKLIAESLELQRAVFGPDSTRVARILQGQADVRERQGRYPAAIALVEEALAILRRTGDAETYEIGYYEDSLARLNLKAGRYETAEQRARAALAIYQQTLGNDHLYIASTQHVLGEILLARGDAQGAVKALRISVAICTKAAGAESWRTARSQSLLGAVLGQLGKHAEAEQLLVESHRTLLKTVGAADENTRVARQRVLTFLRSQGREREAARLLAPAPATAS